MALGLSWRREGCWRVGNGGGYDSQQRLAVSRFLEAGRGAASQGALAVCGGILPGEPLLVVIDGNSGLRKAVRESFPDSWVQRCQVHRMRNILYKLPEKTRPGLKKLLQKAFTAQSYKAGVEQAQAVVAMCQEQFPEAMKCLRTDLEGCLTALRFPEPHRKRIRTTNLLERLFREGQRRSKVVPRFMNERSGLSLLFAVLVDASAGWRGVRITPAINRELDSLKMDYPAKLAVRLVA